MIESSLPHVSHKTAPFRAPVRCGNRSSGVQPISINRVFVSCSGVIDSSLILVCHTERRPQFNFNWVQIMITFKCYILVKYTNLAYKLTSIHRAFNATW